MFNRKEATDMDQKKTGSFLRELRKEKQLTQEQLAERFGVTNRSVSRRETGSKHAGSQYSGGAGRFL